MTQNNLGAAYRTLAKVKDKAENCQKAVAAFEKALKVRTLEDFPINYAMTQNNLGAAYRTLAKVKDNFVFCIELLIFQWNDLFCPVYQEGSTFTFRIHFSVRTLDAN